MVVFNLEYIIALLSALVSAYLIQAGSPGINPFISYFLVPLLVAYLVVQVINNVFPHLNRFGRNVHNYVENKTLSEINSLGYLQIFPPLFAIIIIFFVLLYNRNLG